MPSFGSGRGDVLYLVVTGAAPARDTPALVEALQADGWDVCVVTTPSGRRWVDVADLERRTGHVVRTDMRGPDDPPFEPFGDALVVAPATFNTINKLAAGINDTLALGLTNEALGTPGVPVVLCPHTGEPLRAHPAFARSSAVLREAGAIVVDLDDAAALVPAVVAAVKASAGS